MALKRWLLFIVIFTISLTAILSILIYTQAREPYKEALTSAESYTLKNNLLETIDESYVYNSTDSYQTIIGDTKDGSKKAFFIPLKANEEPIMEVSFEEGISKEEAISIVLDGEQESKVLHAKLGVEEVGPVWEITFVNSKDNLNYVYLLFDNGDWWKRISNL